MFKAFPWGEVAHANPKEKALVDEWRQVPFLFPMLENDFIGT